MEKDSFKMSDVQHNKENKIYVYPQENDKINHTLQENICKKYI